MNLLFSRDSWNEILTTVRKNKTRTIITIIGVLWGIFLLIGLLGSAKGMENGFKLAFGDFATNSIIIWGQSTSLPFKGFQQGRRVRLRINDIESIKKEVPEIKVIAPRNQLGEWSAPPEVVYGLKSYSFTVYGDYPALSKVDKKKMIYGRFINQNDIDKESKVVVITEDIYKLLFDKDENPIGKYIKINQIQFQVIGLNKPSETIGIDPDETIFMPFTTFQKVFSQGDKISWMIAGLHPDANTIEVENKIMSILKRRHDIHPDDSRALGVFNLGKAFKKITNFLTGMKFLTVFVGLATLLAGVIGISAILLIAVKERTREIGIRRALGATPSEVRNQILLESVFLTLIAGIIGIVLGVLFLALLSTLAGGDSDFPLLNPTVSFYTIFGALFFMVSLGTLVGLIPAYKAVSIKPIEALRDE